MLCRKENEVYFGNPYKRVQEKAVFNETALESEINLHANPQRLAEITIPQKEQAYNIEETTTKVEISKKEEKSIMPFKKITETYIKEDNIAENYYKECFVFNVAAENGIQIQIQKSIKDSMEDNKYDIFIKSIGQYSTKVLKLIRTFQGNSDAELFSLIHNIVTEGNFARPSYTIARRRFIAKITTHLKLYKPSSTLLKSLKELSESI